MLIYIYVFIEDKQNKKKDKKNSKASPKNDKSKNKSKPKKKPAGFISKGIFIFYYVIFIINA